MNSSEGVQNRNSLASKQLTIGFCAQENNLPPTLTLAELIHLFSSLHDSNLPTKVENRLKQDELLYKLNLSNHLNSQYGTLSVGAKRRVALMMALLNRPQLILLDEPVTGLDDLSSKEFWMILEQFKGSHTIVVITHDITSA